MRMRSPLAHTHASTCWIAILQITNSILWPAMIARPHILGNRLPLCAQIFTNVVTSLCIQHRHWIAFASESYDHTHFYEFLLFATGSSPWKLRPSAIHVVLATCCEAFFTMERTLAVWRYPFAHYLFLHMLMSRLSFRISCLDCGRIVFVSSGRSFGGDGRKGGR